MSEQIKQKSTLSFFNTFFLFLVFQQLLSFYIWEYVGIVQGTTLTVLELSFII